ncbi:response regulator [Janibacter sp. GS2]|uniref:response regulator n=1 Tax=Janibacter sp. GS2 TaxID=3442646 RepID=UPI003EBA4266
MTQTPAPARVVIVDDDFMVVRVHRGFLESIPGFNVVGDAGNAAEALQAVEDLEPDLVLLDIYLPDRSGLEVLRALRTRERPVDVIVVTAARDVQTVQSAHHGGVAHYLVKPFTRDELARRLRDWQTRHDHLSSAATHGRDLGQGDIDRLFTGVTRRKPNLPKGLSAETLSLVARTVHEAATPLTAAGCAERTGLARVTARRYLTFLADAERVRAVPRYGQQGRPELTYEWVS